MIKTDLPKALNEKDVENIYRSSLIQNFTGSTITSPHKVDGLLETKEGYSVLLEFKHNETFTSKLAQCNVLVQSLFYLKKFEGQGTTMPAAVFIGDINECFVLPSKVLTKYLTSPVNWSTPASDAHRRNPDLLLSMVNDPDIQPFIFNIDSRFEEKHLVEKIKSIATNSEYKVKVTEQNIANIYDYFQRNVLPKNSGLTSNQEANLFVQLIINPSDNYVHPKKKNILLSKTFGEVKIIGSSFTSFFKHYEGETYSPREKEKLTGFVDRLIEDVTRRRKGEFFTPTAFVDKSQEYITRALGPDWRDEYVVWDCACGTGNLTRDYQFKELYCSTLEQSDLDTAEQAGHNPSATKFQFDFLNDDDNNLPAGLIAALNDPAKKVLFYINPPYGTANSLDFSKNNTKKSISNTSIESTMKKDGWGSSSRQLYAQFLYKISKYNTYGNITIAVFAKSLYKTGSSYSGFRANFYRKFHFESGMLFCASHFADTASSWGIDFSVWASGKENRNTLPVDLLDTDPVSFKVINQGVKNLYNLDKSMEASEWVRQEVKGIKTNSDSPQFSSALTVKHGKGKLADNALGYSHNNGNSVRDNQTLVGLYSSAFSVHQGFSVIPANFEKATALFAARKVVKGTWIDDKDEYLAPNEQHTDYQQFATDSLVYALFNNSSQQSSMRQVTYKNKKHDIKNEFFWMPKIRMQELAEKHDYDELYRDTKNSGNDRYVHNMLFIKSGSLMQANDVYSKLSPDAKRVLDMATELVEKSFGMRQIVSQQHPEYHLDCWDAGYAQLKLVWKDYHKLEFKAFRDAYKAFENRMRPLVYTLGFLQ